MYRIKRLLEGSMPVVVYMVLLAYPATMFVYKGIRSEYFGVLVLMALAGLAVGAIRPSMTGLSGTHKGVLWAFLLMSVVAWLSYAYFGFQEVARPRVTKYTWFALAVPVYFLFRLVRPRADIVWLGVVVGALVACGRALLEEFKLVEEISWDIAIMRGRANGVMHPIRFGDLSLLLGFVSLAGTLYLDQVKRPLRVLGVVAFVAGLVASILSLSRGGWLAIPLLLFVVFWPWLKYQGKTIRYLVPVLAIAVLVAISFTPSLEVGKRFDQVRYDLVRYFEKGKSGTSLGDRLDMFKTALHLFRKHPFFGVGVGGYHPQALGYFEQNQGELSRGVIMWKNPHNEFLLQAATRGVVGIAVILLLFVLMGRAFVQAVGQEDASIRFHAVAGLSLVIGYAVFGMSIALFEHRDFLLFFVIYSMLFLAGSGTSESESE